MGLGQLKRNIRYNNVRNLFIKKILAFFRYKGQRDPSPNHQSKFCRLLNPPKFAMATSEVKLLGARASPYVNRVQIALNLKNIDYEFILEKLPEKKSDLLLKSNPVHKKIPVLIHGDKPVCESLIIVEYIDEAWTDGPFILPSDPFDRANARFWAAYIDQKWFPLFGEMRRAEDEESKAALLEKICEGVVLLEDAFVKSSKGKAFFGGDTIGFLDIALGCILGWLKVAEIMGNQKIFDESKAPGLVGWAENFLSDKAVKDVIPTPEELMELLKSFEAAAAAAAASK